MKVKLCGFTDKKSVETAVKENCDFLGFIFVKSSVRFVVPEVAEIISADVPKNIAKVAVVADAEIKELSVILRDFNADYFQFHGAEDVQFLKQVKKKFPQIKIIKAFHINSAKDLELVEDFSTLADFFLFDGPKAGSGKVFDWKLLHNFQASKPWFLSGGINIDNIGMALETTGATMVDISSGIEEVRGKKSSKLIMALMQKIKEICSQR